jgi:hypothetical protein
MDIAACILSGTFRGRNNNMNDMTQASTPTPAGTSSLWAAIACLGVVVIALGSALYFVQTRQGELRAANTLSEAASPVTTTLPPAGAPQALPAQPRAGEKNKTTMRDKHLP